MPVSRTNLLMKGYMTVAVMGSANWSIATMNNWNFGSGVRFGDIDIGVGAERSWHSLTSLQFSEGLVVVGVMKGTIGMEWGSSVQEG